MSTPQQPLLQVTDLHKHFPIKEGLLIERKVGEVRAVDGVSFDVQPGETLSLVGESGSGKSTTGYCVLQLMKPTSGSVKFEGTELTELGREELRRMRREMQIVFQDPYSSLDPRMTVGDIVGEPLVVHGIGTRRDRSARIRDLLDVVGFNPSYTNRYPHEFSGGQRQRIGIARALALSPKLIVCDEPVSALDVSIQAQILNLLKDLQRDFGLTYLFIAHDLAVVRGMSDRIAVMNRGQIVELGPAEEVYTNPQDDYTKALLSAVPVPDPRAMKERKAARRQLRHALSQRPLGRSPVRGCEYAPKRTIPGGMLSPRARPAAAGALVAVAAWLAFYTGWLLLAPAGEHARLVFADTAYLVPIVAAVLLSAWTATRVPKGLARLLAARLPRVCIVARR